ncbi:MAG: DUF4038 domain-containing protein [Myxococcota bacterium]
MPRTPEATAEGKAQPFARAPLLDTWWYGLTSRVPDAAFDALAEQRHREGFTGVQLVVGLPPEVGPESVHARSPEGLPWSGKAVPNARYLRHARQRIERLRRLGLDVVVYGGWGHHIDLVGVAGMRRWWRAVIEALDDLEPVWCLTGELHLWLLRPQRLGRTGTTGSLGGAMDRLRDRAAELPLRVAGRLLPGDPWQARARARSDAWTAVLEELARSTKRPLLVHPTADRRGRASVGRPDLLAAETVHTSHARQAAPRIWREAQAGSAGGRAFYNLEPWYEGILDDFRTADQLHAYWASMSCGASGHAYGAHGIWNAGDGRFLAHWGTQSWDEARALPTGALLGESHRLVQALGAAAWPVARVEARGDELVSATRAAPDGRRLTFVPAVEAAASWPPADEVFLPLEGRRTAALPASGPAVLLAG